MASKSGQGGHANVATTLTSDGKLWPYREGELTGAISLDEPESDSALLAELRAIVNRR